MNTMDYRHLYVVHMPPGKLLPAGYNGASAVSLSVTPPHLVWYNWSALNPRSIHLNPAYSYSARQMAAQAWAHEVWHHLESPWPGGCTAGSARLCGICLQLSGRMCNGMQHASPGCGEKSSTPFSGTSVVTASYWSDQDGKCIAPGSGDTWKREPGAQPGGT